MTANTGNQGFTYPLGTDPPENIDNYIEGLAKQVEARVVMQFDSVADRDTKLTGIYAPTIGQVCILLDTLTLMKYNGSSWVNVFPTITTSTGNPTGGVNGDIWFKI